MRGAAAASEHTLVPENRHVDGLALRTLDDIRSHVVEDVVDPRISGEQRPSSEQLDQSFVRRLSGIVYPNHQQQRVEDAEIAVDGKKKEEVIYVRRSFLFTRSRTTICYLNSRI